MIVIRGGEVRAGGGWLTADVVVDHGLVSMVGEGADGDVVIDATGCLVGPGLVDMHTHLREPGDTAKEDIFTASRAAAAGGFTAVTAMPNTDPPMDSPEVVSSVLAAAEVVGIVDVVPSAAITRRRTGAALTDIPALYELGVRLFTDDGDCVCDGGMLRSAMEIVSGLPGAMIAQHAEDPSMTSGGHMHDGLVASRLGIGGLPAEAESEIVRRDLELVARTGARYHCQHVSAKMTVELIRSAKNRGLPVTAEVTPHHLTFDESSLEGLDPDFKMYPPLRTAEDRSALVDALRDGTIDAVATDHAPHLREEKAAGFAAAPRGVIGLETAAAATWEALEDRDRFFDVLSTNPARALGLEGQGGAVEAGSRANLMVFDPAARWVPGTFESKSSNSPYRGREMRGHVRATIHEGKLVYQAEVGVS